MVQSSKINWSDNFQRVNEDSSNWAQQAKRLMAAADTLRWTLFQSQNEPALVQIMIDIPISGTQYNGALVGAYLLLSGLALENLCKAVLVAAAPSEVTEMNKPSDPRKLSKTLRTHILKRLMDDAMKIAAKLARVDLPCRSPLNDDEKRLIERLTAFAEWGRYIAPTNHLQWEQAASNDVMRNHTDAERDVIDSLYKWLFKLHSAVQLECYDPSAGCSRPI